MAVRYYDDALVAKISKWIPQDSKLRVLRPDETKRLFETKADDKRDAPLKLPLIALSRDKNIELKSNIKQTRSYDGITYLASPDITSKINMIPIQVNYQLDIYTKTYEEGDEYVRNFLFKLINNPTFYIIIPYNSGVNRKVLVNGVKQDLPALKHIVNIRVLSTVSDTSDIAERIFPGEFTRWSIQFELQDAYLFSVPYKSNWKFDGVELGLAKKLPDPIELDEIEDVKIDD